MAKVINLTLHRRMRELQKNVDDLSAGRTPRILVKGRTQGKTMGPIEMMNLMEMYLKHPPVPVSSYLREVQEETGMILDAPKMDGRIRFLPPDIQQALFQAERTQVQSAQVIPFKRPAASP